MKAGKQAHLIRVGGIVQGVGFRVFVFRLATAHGLAGWVFNSVSEVEIHVEGDAVTLEAFRNALTVKAPPAARVERVDVTSLDPCGAVGFEIR